MITLLVIFNGNVPDVVGKCGRILGVVIMFNISLHNVSFC